MSAFLEQVCREARDRVAAARAGTSFADLRARALARPRPPSFADALQRAVIAEVKRASPSKGMLVADADAAAQARAYVAGGAAAISVLTEPAHFRGSLDDLRSVASAVPVPVLRKDFVVDEYQVAEAREAGASAVLLLVAALEQQALIELLRSTARLGLDPLIETHDADEIVRALDAIVQAPVAGRPVIGVNARDLRRLSVDRSRFAELAAALPERAIIVAESGVAGPDDATAYVAAGADAVLVGEHLMLAADPATSTAALVEAVRQAQRSRSTRPAGGVAAAP